jgi:hypothetical protein
VTREALTAELPDLLKRHVAGGAPE